MKYVKIVLALALAAGLAGCGACKKKKEPPPPSPVEKELTEAVGGWAAGQWCEYRLTEAGGKEADVGVTLTGKESRLGRDYFWLEIVVERDGRKVISKALVPQLERVSFLTSGKDLTKESERLIIKVGDEPAVELPLKELQLLQQLSEITGKGPKLDELFAGGEGMSSREEGPAEYTTRGGKKLACTKLVLTRDGQDQGTVLACDEVPIFGIAYSEQAKGKLELVDFGPSGATTAVTEEPTQLELGGLAKDLKDFKNFKIK